MARYLFYTKIFPFCDMYMHTFLNPDRNPITLGLSHDQAWEFPNEADPRSDFPLRMSEVRTFKITLPYFSFVNWKIPLFRSKFCMYTFYHADIY